MKADLSPNATAAQIESWLVSRMARALGCPAEDVDPDAAFADFGLDSVAALSLTGDLEKQLRRSLPSTLLYEYPTIRTLSHFLGAR